MEKVIIIGSGPAGLTAAIYTGRAQLKPLVIGGKVPGGQLMLTTEVDNFPGFSEGITGPELISEMRKQATRFGATFVDENVTDVDFSGDTHKITVGEKTYEAEAIVIATGADARWLHLPNEQRLIGKGVSSCATCDGFFYKDKKVVVIGGGDSAMEEATFLTKFASEVVVVHRRDKLRASKIMQQKAFDNPKISFQWNKSVTDVLGEEKVTGVQLTDTQTEEVSELETDGVFLAIGHIPNTDVFEQHITRDDKGYLIVEGDTHTNKEGVFVAGDVFDTRYRQAITAAGSGAKAAIDAEKYIETKEA